jgi:hypothetical protein
MMPDRTSFADSLALALAAAKPAQEVNELLRRVLMSEPSDWQSDEQHLVRRISERIDAVAGHEERVLVLARDVQRLLEGASSTHAVTLLLDLIVDRERSLAVLQKYDQDTISRTSLLSFVAEQHWPDAVRHRIIALTPPEFRILIAALAETDIEQLEALLTS